MQLENMQFKTVIKRNLNTKTWNVLKFRQWNGHLLQ